MEFIGDISSLEVPEMLYDGTIDFYQKEILSFFTKYLKFLPAFCEGNSYQNGDFLVARPCNNLMIRKVSSLGYEHLIYEQTNELRRDIPNFQYEHAHLMYKHPIFMFITKEILSSSPGPCFFSVREFPSGISLSNYKVENMKNILIQIFGALGMLYEKINFYPKDLNVIVNKLKKSIVIQYTFSDEKFVIETDELVTFTELNDLTKDSTCIIKLILDLKRKNDDPLVEKVLSRIFLPTREVLTFLETPQKSHREICLLLPREDPKKLPIREFPFVMKMHDLGKPVTDKNNIYQLVKNYFLTGKKEFLEILKLIGKTSDSECNKLIQVVVDSSVYDVKV